MDFILRPFTEMLLCVKNDLGMNLVKFVTGDGYVEEDGFLDGNDENEKRFL